MYEGLLEKNAQDTKSELYNIILLGIWLRL
jgi:hypothetical protein